MESAIPRLRLRSILAFWLPLAITWIFMALEGPYLSGIVARLGAPVQNLAAYGLAFSLAWLAESPIIMLLTASAALAEDRPHFLALRRFTFLLNSAVTVLLVFIVLPPVFRFFTEGLIGLPPELSRIAHQATVFLLPWPAAIGYRRFYQGLLVRNHRTRQVAYGTAVRLGTMSIVAALLAFTAPLPGASIGALALSSGVLAEAAVIRWMSRHLIQNLMAETSEVGPEPSLSELAHFYFPLALTSMISMSLGPLLTFFMGRGSSPVQCLAAWPVVHAFIFLFRSGGVAFQEVAVVLGRGSEEHTKEIRRAAILLASIATALLACIVFTPLAHLWFQRVAGLSAELVPFAILPVRVIFVLPALEYVLSIQRTHWILRRETSTVTIASAIEAAGLVLCMSLLIPILKWNSTLSAAIALTLGRIAANAFLMGKRLRHPHCGEQR